MNNIIKLQNWYLKNCDGDWEHEYGVKIYTLDNPGWVVNIDLSWTEFQDIEHTYERIEHSDNDWIGFEIKNSIFDGSGDPSKLDSILDIFFDIVEKGKIYDRITKNNR